MGFAVNTKCSAKLRKVLFSDKTFCASCTSAHQSESLQHLKSKCDDRCGIRCLSVKSDQTTDHKES